MSSGVRQRSPRGSGEQLRDDIIDAVKQLLAEGRGADDISIRLVAQRVGVSAPAIYLHFADKDALLDAVITSVFHDELDAAFAEAVVGATSPLQRLLALGMAYVRFALEHREHYRVALMTLCTEAPEVDDVVRESAFMRLVDAVGECMRAGIYPQGDPIPVAFDLWSAAHGIAALMIAKPYLPWGEAEQFARRALTAAGLGHAVEGLFGEDADFSAVESWVRTRRDSLSSP